MRRLILSTVIAVLSGGIAVAQSLNACDWVASAANIVEPWPVYTTTFANGAVRMALLDTGGEPACCSQHLLILHAGAEVGRACTVLSDQPGLGWGEVIWLGINATYNSSKGLRLDVPIRRYDPDTGTTNASPIEKVSIRINQATGVIEFE